MKWLGDKLDVSQPQDWEKVFYKNISALRGTTPLKDGGMIGLLSKGLEGTTAATRLPTKMIQRKDKSQELLIDCTKSLFPSQEIRCRYKHPQLLFPDTNKPMELDVFLPEISLALEYQGMQHYVSGKLFGDSDVQKSNDQQKLEACRQAGITLIQVPYWWSGDKESLQGTIHLVRPDLVDDSGVSIPSAPEVEGINFY